MEKRNFFFKVENDALQLRIPGKIYPLEAALSATYFFIDDFYIFLAPDGPAGVIVELKPKKKMSKARLDAAAGEFFNSLLAETLRLNMNETNKKFREKLLEQALASALSPAKPSDPDGPLGPSPACDETLELELDAELKLIIERTKDASYTDDPLGICVPFGTAAPAKTAAKSAKPKPAAKRAPRRK
ncbi:MAG: His-Xaa-Ser system protein HxsD [bacterium]